MDDSWEQFRFLVFTGVLGVLVALLLNIIASRKVNPREPPVVPSFVPYVGHLLGMIFHGGKYFKILGARHHHPIFTLPILGSRTYVVTDPALAASVQRSSKTLSFNPIIPEVTQRILGLDDETVKIVRKNLDRENGIRGFIPEIHDMVYSTLGPGSSLDELSAGAATELQKEVNAYSQVLKNQAPSGKAENLLLWTRHFVTIATAQFLYGPKNPLAVNPELEDMFWDFDHGIGGLLLNFLPSITARKALKGREAIVEAFCKYLEEANHKSGSSIIQQRVEIAKRHGFSRSMIARSELSFLFAGIVNTATTSFWMVAHIFSRPELLKAIRTELEGEAGHPAEEKIPDIVKPEYLRDNCPLFLSVFRETLRLGSDNSSSRLVMTDTVLADRYFLPANSVLQISGGIIHSDKAIWGEDAAVFNPERFMDASNSHTPRSTSKDKSGLSNPTTKPQIHPAAFRAFGGGTTLCPGRHFATNEILGLVASIILQFDIISSTDGQTIKVPKKKDNVLPVHILEPVKDVKVKVHLRAS